MRRTSQKTSAEAVSSDDDETLVSRLCAGFIAAPIFEVSLLAAVFLLAGRWGARVFMSEVPAWTHVVYMGVAAVIGFTFGLRGLVWLLGHLFLTHKGSERNISVTAAVWLSYAAILFAAYAVWRQ